MECVKMRGVLIGLSVFCWALVLVVSPAVAVHKRWDPGPAIWGNITEPGANENPVVTMDGQDVTHTVQDNDWDHWIDVDDEGHPVGEEGLAADELPEDKHTWTASGGSFPNGNVGRSVVWRSAENAGNYTVSVQIDDLPLPVLPSDEGNRNDGPITVNHNAAVASLTVKELSFKNDHQMYYNSADHDG